MSAIAGYWTFGGQRPHRAQCERMLRAQQVYGPGNPVLWSGNGLSMGRRLKSVLREEQVDCHRITGISDRFTIIGDIRLDNRAEIAERLGCTLSGHVSDSALLASCWQHFEEASLQLMVGEFAFAVWDRPKQQLILARDFLGLRPLHFGLRDGVAAFSSMPKGLHALEEFPVTPDDEAMGAFLALLPEVGLRTFFLNIYKVPAGHYVVVDRDGFKARRYWQPARKDLGLKSGDEYVQALREHLDQAVRSCLRGSETEVSTQLSAGLDSSTVTATAANLMGASSGKVTAYTAVPREGYPDPGLRGRFVDEGPLALETARAYANIDHVLIRTNGISPLANLERNFFLYERPYLNLCNAVWVDAIFDAAKKRRSTVMLGATMGNMSFSYAGFPRLAQFLKSGRILLLLREMKLLVANGYSLEGLAAQTIGPFLPTSFWSWILRRRGRTRAISLYSALRPALFEQVRRSAAEQGFDTEYKPTIDDFSSRVSILQRVDQGNYNKGVLAGWGIEVRDPSADKRLVEFCLSVPIEQFLRDGQPRALARRAASDRVPSAVLQESRKGYQAADWHEGLTSDIDGLKLELSRQRSVEQAVGLLDQTMMTTKVADWPNGGWHQHDTANAYRLSLLRGISAGHFLRKASGSNA